MCVGSVARQESPGSLSRFFLNLFFSRYRKEGETFEEMEESDGERVVGSDTVEGTDQRAIRVMPIVTTLSYVGAFKDKTRGVWITLRCYNYREYVRCEKPQETPIHLSTDHTTMRVSLQQLEENHDNCTEILTKKTEDLDPSRVSQISW
jgi:hypothetical protein